MDRVCYTYNSHKDRARLNNETVCTCSNCVELAHSIWGKLEDAEESVARNGHALVIKRMKLEEAYDLAMEGGGFMIGDYIKKRCGIPSE